MSYPSDQDHSISLQEAETMTKRFRDNQSSTTYIKSELFGADAIKDIFSQADCVGVRIYYGMDKQDVPKLIIVGVNQSGDDLYNGLLVEKGLTCPPDCDTTSPLANDATS
jgi:hypothetical protein